MGGWPERELRRQPGEHAVCDIHHGVVRRRVPVTSSMPGAIQRRERIQRFMFARVSPGASTV